MSRYDRNIKTLSLEENEKLKDFKVCVIGCGGLGGYIIEMLGRIGVGHITAVDGDTFSESNLNRQIISSDLNLGKNKAIEAKKRMKVVNDLIYVNPITTFINKDNVLNILKEHDVVIDAVDNIETRFLLQESCEKLKIPFIHGAIAGWYGQVTTIFPGDRTLDIIYKNKSKKGIEDVLGNPSFTPALVASIQVSEALKVLINRGEILRNKIFMIDLLYQDFYILNLKE
ncbi:HesA/MoeB/ThiF family protein [Clostridium botulinum]|nr:HesA/MoeB/ThiF family protein [Clostridium botulinum]